jgi:hypothetical protein
LISLNLQRNFQSSVPRWTSKNQKQKQKHKHKQKMRMHADELLFLMKRQINTPTPLRCCGTKSLSSSQILNVL